MYAKRGKGGLNQHPMSGKGGIIEVQPNRK